jgi:chromosome segregation ATPase
MTHPLAAEAEQALQGVTRYVYTDRGMQEDTLGAYVHWHDLFPVVSAAPTALSAERDALAAQVAELERNEKTLLDDRYDQTARAEALAAQVAELTAERDEALSAARQQDKLREATLGTLRSVSAALDAAEAKVAELTAERDEWRTAYHKTHEAFSDADAARDAAEAKVARLQGAKRRIKHLPDEIEQQVETTRGFAKDSGMDRHQVDLMATCTSHFLDYARQLRAALTEGDTNG